MKHQLLIAASLAFFGFIGNSAVAGNALPEDKIKVGCLYTQSV